MKTFNDYVLQRESKFHIELDDGYTPIYFNPTNSELMKLFQKGNTVRGFTDSSDNVYIWSGYSGWMHGNVSREIKVPLAVAFYVYDERDGLRIEPTQFARDGMQRAFMALNGNHNITRMLGRPAFAVSQQY